MPSAQHPQAKFDPIPPDLDLYGLVDRTPNFKWVQRVSRAQIRNLGQQEFEKLVAIHVIAGGKPLVIDGWDSVLPRWLFSMGWLEKTYDKKQENVRDISNATDIPMTTGHYLRSMRQLTNQWTPTTFRDERRQRLYLKDIDCPDEWRDVLQKVIHPSLFYLNENVTKIGGKSDQDEDIFRSEATAASAGDLMSSLPEEMRAQNLMCYIGHEGTYTPAHREMCASLGQNIMVEASGEENGEKPGSSLWFMTESKDREVVREYFLSMLGHDIEIEKHFAQINAWKKAPFDVYVVEQRAGDFILIPPLAAHQVWNRGTRTMKVAWNRTTVETLDLALHEALPKARLVCRDEQYKNKAIIYYTLQKYHQELQDTEEKAELTQMSFMGLGQDIIRNSPRAKQLAGDFKKLFSLFTEILVDEVFAFKEKDVEFLPFDSCVTCSYCRSNIFNRFLTCKHCVRPLVNGDEDAYDICMECYAMGRSCACLSGLQWCEQWAWSDLVDSYETWRATVIMNDGFVDLDHSPQPLEVARQRAGKKSVAQVCQEALKRRPWKDITKPDRENTPSDSEPDGEEKSTKKPKRKKKKGELLRCHVCCHRDYNYRVHTCTNPGCTEGYCYGVLYRAFDMMPQKVLEDEHWQCPKCLGICNCGHCRRAGTTNPYTPKNTSLGHDTRRVADDRSVEALVDFRVHNLSWLKAAGEESRSKTSRRMQRLREQADNAKAQDLTEQVEAERRMQNDMTSIHNADASIDETSAMNGYGDQSHVLGHTDASVADYPFHHSNSQNLAGAAPANSTDGMANEPNDEGADVSSYPDPSVFARQRIGLGYYEQDDTPDKILFDPYQAPSTDSIRLDESDVPEFVKKSIRAAKRKAKRENEDPDFVVGKSHHKKPRLIPEQTDFLDSMDPALFDEGDPSAPFASMTVAEQMEPKEAGEPPDSMQDGQERQPQKRTALWFDANEPALRHAKPLTSYVEIEDLDVDDDEELEPAIIEGMPAAEGLAAPNDSSPNPINQAAIAAGSLLSRRKPESAMAREPEKSQAASQKTSPRKRGRPPKRLSTVVFVPDPDTPTPPTPSAGPGSMKRRRGRPRKSTLSVVQAVLDELPELIDRQSDVESSHDHGLKVRDTNALSDHTPSDTVNENQRLRRGRPRRSGVTTIAAASMDIESDAGSDGDFQISNAAKDKPQPKKRGRPRRSEIATETSSARESLPMNTQFMTMAERMALKGKSFKMGRRKSQGTATHAAISEDTKNATSPSSENGEGSQEGFPERASDDESMHSEEETSLVTSPPAKESRLLRNLQGRNGHRGDLEL
ncbi:C-module-binding factor A [Cladobotryum mycophilum]|uniref:C-module-binding factor A n=1 Tax=Cladobotryum mycophilum TaxID=491253 RepID=A0ABR0T043_9HYPO